MLAVAVAVCMKGPKGVHISHRRRRFKKPGLRSMLLHDDDGDDDAVTSLGGFKVLYKKSRKNFYKKRKGKRNGETPTAMLEK